MPIAESSRSAGLTLALCVGLGACGPDAGAGSADRVANAGSGAADGVPAFEVDPGWPLEMPDLWVMGSVTGVFVDESDHVWVTHLPETLTPEETSAVQDPPIGTCCRPAPAVIEFDPSGAVVQAWGEPSQPIEEYPRNPHGIFVDHAGYVWIGTYRHHRVQKFTRSGELVLTIGEYDVTEGSDSPTHLGGPAGIWVDPSTNEAFVADGYGNRRVVVFDGDTGAYLRHWGAYGDPPDDSAEVPRGSEATPPGEFATVHGIVGSRDGLVYVADRRGNRLQVFRQDGTFVDEVFVAPETLASGSSFVPVLSGDPEQRWLYLADGTNHKVWILDRAELTVVGEFGRGGRQVGQFLRPHGMAIDSRGNLYVGEASTGRRIQKFTLRP
jgi:sugar lactone lactonase YvrE